VSSPPYHHPGLFDATPRSVAVLTDFDVPGNLPREMAKGSPPKGSTSAGECCPGSTKVRPRSTRPYARLFKALADETRLEIVGLLAARGSELCVCDIESHFELSQPTVSHHLRVLREAELVTSERRGTWVYYALDHRNLALLEEFSALVRK
jgi:ArsR family transcriptional regulator, arsenate/arsenite/antimonite-responsive transcriptional repressor